MSVFDASQLMFNNPSFYNGVIKQSLRYNYGDSPHLTRTADSGNRRTFTFSCWIKRTSFNQTNSVFGAVLNGTNFFMIRFNTFYLILSFLLGFLQARHALIFPRNTTRPKNGLCWL